MRTLPWAVEEQGVFCSSTSFNRLNVVAMVICDTNLPLGFVFYV